MFEWPQLKVDEWTATRDTLHMWTQIVARSVWPRHRWSITGGRFLCTCRTGTVDVVDPYGSGLFDMDSISWITG